MKSARYYENRYGDDKVFGACGLIGILDVTGRCFSGADIVTGITNMTERGNGLGSGFAVYGCYPRFADCYAFHVMYTEPSSRAQIEALLNHDFRVLFSEEVPHISPRGVAAPPIIWRYFLQVEPGSLDGREERDYTVDRIMSVNRSSLGAYIYSSGKDLGVFKGVGQPEQIAEYFGVRDYQGYLWTAHNRFPTNTPGWWGGAHPFGLLDWTVVHNGEISSYGANRRYLESHGYSCTMSTDTEVMAYAADFLMRRHRLPVDAAAQVMAPPLWQEIDRMDGPRQARCRILRQVYSGLLVNGPFTVIIARQGEMIGLSDRIRLRPIVAATGGARLYISSEEAAIRKISPALDRVWSPDGGEPVVGRVGEALPSDSGTARTLRAGSARATYVPLADVRSHTLG